MRRKPDPERALHVPLRQLGPVGLRARVSRPILRRLLVLCGLLICGWLLSSLQSAHAADVPPLPVGSGGVVNAATAPHTGGGHVRDTRSHRFAPRHSTASAPAGPTTDDAPGRPAARHMGTVTHLTTAPPAHAASTRIPAHTPAQAPAHARGILTGARPTTRHAPAAISPGTPATRSAGSTAPRGGLVGGLADLSVAALAPTRAQHAASVPATAAGAEPTDLSPALDAPRPLAAAGDETSVPTRAPGLFPSLESAAPPHPPPVLGLVPAFDSLPVLDALLVLDPAVLDPAAAPSGTPPVFGTPTSLTTPVTNAFGTGPPGASTLTGITALDPLTGLVPNAVDTITSATAIEPASVPAGGAALEPLTRLVTDVARGVPAVIQRPIAGVVTGRLGTLLTSALGPNVLGALTASLTGVLDHVGRLAAHLLPRVDTLVTPAAAILEPLHPIVARTGLATGLVGGTTSVVPRPAGSTDACSTTRGSSTGGWPASAAPADSGHVASGGSGEQQLAHATIVPADQPLGSGPYAATAPALSGQWPQPRPGPDVLPRVHMSGRSSGPLSPGGPDLPLSGASSRALPTSSQNDGSGDTPYSWQARVPETFVSVRIVVPPAVRTAADEPAFSPD